MTKSPKVWTVDQPTSQPDPPSLDTAGRTARRCTAVICASPKTFFFISLWQKGGFLLDGQPAQAMAN